GSWAGDGDENLPDPETRRRLRGNKNPKPGDEPPSVVCLRPSPPTLLASREGRRESECPDALLHHDAATQHGLALQLRRKRSETDVPAGPRRLRPRHVQRSLGLGCATGNRHRIRQRRGLPRQHHPVAPPGQPRAAQRPPHTPPWRRPRRAAVPPAAPRNGVYRTTERAC
ncbi:hypothetical protein T484DRAFT_1898747, partial [Baffinella frigidus]